MPQVIVLSLLLLTNVMAKRSTPEDVPSVRTNDAVISAPHFSGGHLLQNGGFVEARDPKTKKLLWRVQVYKTVYNDELEKDVQDIFIESLSFYRNHNLLILTDEIERVFILNLDSKIVTRVV